MAEIDKSKQDEMRFNLATYLELTCCKLEECFENIENNKYNPRVKEDIDIELRDFYKTMFKDKKPSNDPNNLTNAGKYISVLIGKELREEDVNKRLNKGFAHLWNNLEYITKSPDYKELKRTSRRLKDFFGNMAEIFGNHSEKMLKLLYP